MFGRRARVTNREAPKPKRMKAQSFLLHTQRHAIIEYSNGMGIIINVSNNSRIDTDDTFVHVFSDGVVVAAIKREDVSMIYLDNKVESPLSKSN